MNNFTLKYFPFLEVKAEGHIFILPKLWNSRVWFANINKFKRHQAAVTIPVLFALELITEVYHQSCHTEHCC